MIKLNITVSLDNVIKFSMFFILVMMSISLVIFYMGVGYVLLDNSLLDSRKQERASENRVARVLGLYFRSTTENNSITVIVIY